MADPLTRTYDPAALPHWFRWSVALVVFLPAAFIGWRATDTMHNIPMWDEFETVLRFLLDFRAADSVTASVREFFAMANEHCVLTSRMIFVLVDELTGGVNFISLALVGNSFLVGAVVAVRLGIAERWWRAFALAWSALVLLHLQHHETLFSSYASIDHYQVVFHTTVCLWLLQRLERWALPAAVLFAGFAVFTLTHGVAVMIVGAVLLALAGRRLDGVQWCVACALIFGVFSFVFTSATLIAPVTWSLPAVGRLLWYWLTMVGGVMSLGSPSVAAWGGIGLLAVLGLALGRGAWRRDPFLTGVALTAILGMAFIAYGRFTATGVPALSSRYMVQSGFAWIAVGLLVLRALPQSGWGRAGAWLVLLGAGAMNVLANQRFGYEAWEFSQRRVDAAYVIEETGSMAGLKRPIFPKTSLGDQILAISAREGLYELDVEPSHEVVTPERLELYPIVFSIDKLTVSRGHVHFRGWMLTKEKISTELQPYVQVVQGDRTRLFRGRVEWRPDVEKAYPDRPDALRSGFYFTVPLSQLDSGPHSLRVALIGSRRVLYNETQRAIEVPSAVP
jgi:hypothetical protein